MCNSLPNHGTVLHGLDSSAPLQGNLGNLRNPGVNCSIRPMDLEEVAIVNGKEISVGPSANAGGGFRGDILQQIALQLKIFYVELSILLLFQSNIIPHFQQSSR
jgi:hypothetical protein